MKNHKTIIVGASAAGLACAARLSKVNHDYIVIEKTKQVGNAWRNHYERLHLHTPKSSSQLPFRKFPSSYPKYPSRTQMVSYLEVYASALKILPQFNTSLESANFKDNQWTLITSKGGFTCDNLIVCTGNTNIPNRMERPGIDSFTGKILHSSEYKNGKPFSGKNVLIVGFGNSACEIAICLHEHGAIPALSVRSAVNVLPRDILGISVLQLGIAQASLSPKLADAMNKPLINLIVGNIEKYGLKKLPYGPIEQIVSHSQVPLLDIGTMKLIKSGAIKVYRDVKKLEGGRIYFEEEKEALFDAIVMATGYRTGIQEFLSISEERIADSKVIMKKRKTFGEDNLFLCGFYVASTGMLRELGIESKIIAAKILA